MSVPMTSRARTGLLVGLIAAGLCAQGQVAKVGSKIPEIAFNKLIGADGRSTATELRGNVVMFDWWGNH